MRINQKLENLIDIGAGKKPADVVISGKKMKYGSSADALATMKLVYEIYWADPKWRESFEIERPS